MVPFYCSAMQIDEKFNVYIWCVGVCSIQNWTRLTAAAAASMPFRTTPLKSKTLVGMTSSLSISFNQSLTQSPCVQHMCAVHLTDVENGSERESALRNPMKSSCVVGCCVGKRKIASDYGARVFGKL